MKVSPKKENENVGFHYTVTDEQIKEHQKKSVEEIINWVESKFIYDMQTPQERARMKSAKNFKW